MLLVDTVPGMTLPTDPREDQTPSPQQPAAPTQPAPSPSRRARWPWVVAAAVIVLAVAGGVTYALWPSGSDKAVDQCQTAISGKLKSPSTAKYGDSKVTSEDGNFGTYYEVTGQVDAQNSFGATVRGDYRCAVSQESNGTWLVTESTFTQR